MNTVLAAIDFAAASARVAVTASDLAAALGARLVLFNAFPLPELPANSQVSSEEIDALIADAQAAARSRLSGLAPETAAADVNAACSNDFASEAICREARRLGAELIVIGSPRRGAFHDLIIGGTGRELLRHSPCPVLIIPELASEPKGLAAGS